MSALPATASAAPAAVRPSGRKPSKAIETSSASSGVITPTVPAAPTPTRSCRVRKQAKVSTEPAKAR